MKDQRMTLKSYRAKAFQLFLSVWPLAASTVGQTLHEGVVMTMAY